MLKNLPVVKLAVSDNAYLCSEQLLTRFSSDEIYGAR